MLQASAQKSPVDVAYSACGHDSWGFVLLVASAGDFWLYLQLHFRSSVV